MRGYGSLMVDDDQRVRRRSAMIGAGSMTAAVVLLVIVFLAVDLGSEPGPDTLAPTTLPVTTVDVPDTSPAIIYTPTDPSVTPAPTTSSTIVTSIPLDQRILIASPSGISTVVGTSSTSIDSGSWVIALRLSDGSIVAQKVWPGYQQPGDNTIYRIVDKQVEAERVHVDANLVAVANKRDGATIKSFGRHVPDAETPRAAAEATIGDERAVGASAGTLERTGDGEHLAHTRATLRAFVTDDQHGARLDGDRKSTRLNSSH